MKRLTTDDEKSTVLNLNMFYEKNGEVWVRGGGPYPDFQDVTLVQWIRAAAQKHGLNLTAEDPENLGDEMYDALQDGDETVEGIVALLHAAAVQATEMRERLKLVEDILGDDYDLDRLCELVEADRDGRVRIAQKLTGGVCGTCKHFERFSGRKIGACGVKKFVSDRWGREDRTKEFVAAQSRKACKRYEQREE